MSWLNAQGQQVLLSTWPCFVLTLSQPLVWLNMYFSTVDYQAIFVLVMVHFYGLCTHSVKALWIRYLIHKFSYCFWFFVPSNQNWYNNYLEVFFPISILILRGPRMFFWEKCCVRFICKGFEKVALYMPELPSKGIVKLVKRFWIKKINKAVER